MKYFKSYGKDCFLAPALKLCEACFELCVPLIVKLIIDVGIKEKDTGYIVSMCLVLVALGLVGLVFSVVAQYFSARAAVGFASALKSALFEKFTRLSFTEIDKMGRSAMLNRISGDTGQLQTGVNLTLRLLLRSPFVVLGATVMAFTVDVETASVFIPVILALAVVVFGIMLIGIALYKKSQGKLDELLHAARENLMGVRVIRASLMEKRENESFKTKSDSFIKRQKKSGGFSALLNPLTFVIINIGVIAMLYKGAIAIEHSTLTQGEVVAIYSYISQILVELVKLASLIITITKALACASRISECLELSEERRDGEKLDCKNGISVSFENVSFKYEGDSGYALSDITFEARSGQTIGIIGGTGSGKTALVNLIPAFYPASKGSVKINGRDVNEYDPVSLRSGMGIVMQKAELFSGSIRENISMKTVEGISDDEVMSALHTAMAEDFVMEKDGGLDFKIGQMGSGLSGGQKQRISVARGLAGDPRLIILDDSSSALDYSTDSEMRKRIKELEGDPVVFIVSQRASSVLHADFIIVLENGSAVGIGRHDELLKSCSVYREIYNSQMGREEE